jgi:hypothetical protein
VREPSDTSGTPFRLLSFILKRGEPLVALDYLRDFPSRQWLPTGELFNQIGRILKERAEADVCSECVRSEVINLGLYGESDPRVRRYQSVTARPVDPNTLTAWTRLLAMKEITSIHESGGELRAMLERLSVQYGNHVPIL